MGRESSHGTKELFNLPPLVLKARHLSGSASAGLGLGLVVEDKPTEFSCTFGRCGKPSTSFLDKQSPQAWSPYKGLSLVFTCTKAGPCFFSRLL